MSTSQNGGTRGEWLKMIKLKNSIICSEKDYISVLNYLIKRSLIKRQILANYAFYPSLSNMKGVYFDSGIVRFAVIAMADFCPVLVYEFPSILFGFGDE